MDEGSVMTYWELSKDEAFARTYQRYEVRQLWADVYGVWDTYLLRWKPNAFGQDEMSEQDAESLLADLEDKR